MPRPTEHFHVRPGLELGNGPLFGGILRKAALTGFVFLSIGSIAPGCNHDAPEPSVSVVRTDSAGILLVITPKALATNPLDWGVDSFPDVVIGAGSTPEEQLFGVHGVRQFQDGRILVVDASSRSLKFFDQEGRLLSRVGRKGEGPGEFEDPFLIPAFGTDSLVLWDAGLLRFQVFSSHGQGNRTIVLRERWPAGGVPPVGAHGSRMLVREREMVTRATYRGANGPVGHPWDYSWLDLPTGIQDTIASFVVTREYVTQQRGGLAPLSSSIPFASVPSAAVSGSGALVTEGDTPEIREYDLHGNPRRILRVGGFRRPVTRSMVEAKINQLASSTNYGRSYWEQRYSEIPIPDTLPAFSSLKVDDLGWIWAEVYEWDPEMPRKWMVFDPLGQALGTVQTPQRLEVQWIGRDFILGVWHDSLGVEYVRRHQLNRNLEASIVS